MLDYDRQIMISSANNRKATFWPAVTIHWSELVRKLEVPVRGTETITEYLSMPKSRQDDLKDVGGFVGGQLRGNRRKANSVMGRDIVTLDMDDIPSGGTDSILSKLDSFEYAYVVYSTRKHRPEKPRLRVLFLCDRTVTADEYEPLARHIASRIGLDMCDPTTFDASRLMYWPSCCSDSQYVYQFGDKPMLDVDGVLKQYRDWRNVSEWPKVPGADKGGCYKASKQADPRNKGGIVGAFCRAYDIYSAIEEFIPDSYEPAGDERYTYVHGSTTSGAVVYDDGLFIYSHHATDPAGGRLCNSFDLVRLHKFSHLDDEAKSDTPINKLPSYIEMCRMASQDREVISILDEKRVIRITDDFSIILEPSNWIYLLRRNENGKPIATVNNITVIFCNDPKLQGKIRLDLFSNKLMLIGSVPWDSGDKERAWTNADSGNLVRYLEKVYGIYSMPKFEQALLIAAKEQAYHPIEEYLKGLVWDGIPRLDKLLVDYMGAEDTIYTRTVTRKALTAAVGRIMIPGVKYDNMLVLVGRQGRGKTTLFQKLGKEWFSNSLNSFEGKEAIEGILGKWIHEVGELQALNRSELNAAKNFISRTEDTYRAPYARHTETHPRQCVFFGTTNTRECLRDITGGRRFWPVDIDRVKPTKSVFEELNGEVDQIWAEANKFWSDGETLYLSKEIGEVAHAEQEMHREENPLEGLIYEFIERPVLKNWSEKSLIERRAYWNCEFNRGHRLDLVKRDFICALEIWCECLEKNKGDFRQVYAREINQIIDRLDGWEKTNPVKLIPDYGNQRGFRRKVDII